MTAVLAAGLALGGCSEPPAGGREKPRLSEGMSEEIWKIYGGTESGVAAPPGSPEPEPK